MNTCCPQLQEFGVRHSKDDSVISARLRVVRQGRDLVFVRGFSNINPRVVDIDLGVVAGEFAHDVDDLGVAQVRATFLEGKAEDEDSGVDDLHFALRHELDDFVGDIAGHAVIDAPAGEDDFGVVTDLLRLVGQVVGIDADAVTADQTGTKGQEVPFAAGRFEDFEGIDAQPMEYQGKLVHQGDIEVALGVFDHLGRFGDFDRTRPVGAGGDDAAIQGVDEFSDFGCGARGDFPDGGQSVLLVAGVDALGAVAGKEVNIELETGVLFQQRNADFFRGAGIDRGFVNDDGTLGHDLADSFRGLDQGGEIGALGAINRGRHGNDKDVAGSQLRSIGRETQVFRFGQFGRLDFPGTVTTGLEFVDAALLDVEAGNRRFLAKFDGQRQTNVAETDDGDAGVLGWIHAGYFTRIGADLAD